MRQIFANVLLIMFENGFGFNIFYESNDYISLNDLPLQDARIVRAESSDNNASNVSTTMNLFEMDLNRRHDKDWTWLEDAVKDVAYYLRSHKFNEFDRRYEQNQTTAQTNYHLHFPKPPLRSLHWEVHKYCQVSFLTCVEFLWSRVKAADLKRSDDTAIIIQEQHWKVPQHSKQIEIVEAECQKLKRRDNILANPFQGPLERFQWRTTASYYMCWYTMHDVSHLSHINDQCDNYASCLLNNNSSKNSDFRADDDKPFACALYSFCPDPCCGERFQLDAQRCWDSTTNPCHAVSPLGQRKCILKRNENREFNNIVLNRFNVTCSCPKAGYVWDSSYGICVDIDECLTLTHRCDKKNGEACLNTPGYYKCVCKWGYTWMEKIGVCLKNDALDLIKLTNIKANETKKPREKSMFRRLYKTIFKSSAVMNHHTDFSITIFLITSSFLN